MEKSNNYSVIMAGGIGSRFWPMSRSNMPKQFLDMLGTGKSLIRQTFERLLLLSPADQIYVVTNKAYKELVLEHLPELAEHQVLLEPEMRNTAPCVAYAAYKIAKINPEANMIVAPSDHLITESQQFVDTIELALQQTVKTNDLVTLGIKPSRPDTGYGYIHFDTGIDGRVKPVIQFTEKPNLETATKFLEGGEHYWNSGIFIWSIANISREFESHLPTMANFFKAAPLNTDQEQDFINQKFAQCENISIDYGIMEKAKEVAVVLADFGWSDLGTWGSLSTHLTPDQQGNTSPYNNVRYYDSADNMVQVSKDKMAVLEGLEGYIVIETEKALLVCRKENEQLIKKFSQDLKAEGKTDQV